MHKFLRLVEENKPGKQAGKGPYTVEYKDMQGNVMARLTMPDDVGSSYANFLKFANGRGKLEVAAERPVEDQNVQHPVEDQEVTIGGEKTEFSVDDAVEGLGSKAATGLKGFGAKILGTAAQNAKAAVEERERLGKDATGLYKAKNREFKTAIQNQKKGGY